MQILPRVHSSENGVSCVLLGCGKVSRHVYTIHSHTYVTMVNKISLKTGTFYIYDCDIAEFPRRRIAALLKQGGGGGSLHGHCEGGRRPEAPRPGHQRHAKERSQAAVDRAVEWSGGTSLVSVFLSVSAQ